VWVDGIHLKVSLDQDKVCLLVMIGVRADGRKELIALADGFRESAESSADLLRSCRRRGMAAPVLAIGDGALGFWKAMPDVFAETKEQRCWWHKTGNVLAALPKSAHPGAKAALAEIYNTEDRDHAVKAAQSFERDFGAKYPKAVAKITDGLDVLLEFFQLPRRALGTPAHHEPDQVHFRHREAAHPGHQGTRLQGRRHRHGIQAHRVSPPRRSGTSRSHVPQGETRRTTHPRKERGASRLNQPIHRS